MILPLRGKAYYDWKEHSTLQPLYLHNFFICIPRQRIPQFWIEDFSKRSFLSLIRTITLVRNHIHTHTHTKRLNGRHFPKSTEGWRNNTMGGTSSRSQGSCGETIEYMCLCVPLWEFLLDDYQDYTILDRLQDWRDSRRYKKLQRKSEREKLRLTSKSNSKTRRKSFRGLLWLTEYFEFVLRMSDTTYIHDPWGFYSDNGTKFCVSKDPKKRNRFDYFLISQRLWKEQRLYPELKHSKTILAFLLRCDKDSTEALSSDTSMRRKWFRIERYFTRETRSGMVNDNKRQRKRKIKWISHVLSYFFFFSSQFSFCCCYFWNAQRQRALGTNTVLVRLRSQRNNTEAMLLVDAQKLGLPYLVVKYLKFLASSWSTIHPFPGAAKMHNTSLQYNSSASFRSGAIL